MEITVLQREGVTVVSLVGSVDGLTAGSVAQSFREQVLEGRVRLVGDLSQVSYTSSAGLRTLLETLKETRQKGGDLRLAGVRPEVRRVLDLAGFTAILKLFEDTDAAVASYAG
jgi:anti-sigma B factor antagonist